MGKSSRRKKEKAKDFAKPKLKVGKKLAAAANVTETAFKSSAVYLPKQLEKAADGTVTSQRGVTLKALLKQLNHFNGNTRAMALSDIVDVCGRNADLLAVELVNILNGAGPLAYDSHRRVRLGFERLLKLVVESVDSDRLKPQMTLLCAQVSCAQTHPSESIRGDACLYINSLVTKGSAAVLFPEGMPLLSNLVLYISGRLKGSTKPTFSDRKGSVGRGGAESSDQAVMRKHIEHLQIAHNFLQVLCGSGSTGGEDGCSTCPTPVIQVASDHHCLVDGLLSSTATLTAVWKLPREWSGRKISQTRDVVIHTFLTADTIEQRIIDLQKKKTALADGVLSGSKSSAKKLTLQDMRMLFSV